MLDDTRQQWLRTLFTLVAIVTKLACFFISVVALAELAIYIDTPGITLDQAAAWAQKAGYEESDVNDIVKAYRKSKKA